MSVDFVLRNNEFYVKRLPDYPELRKIAELNGLFTVVRVEDDDLEKVKSLLGTDHFYSFPTVLSLCDRQALEGAGIIQISEQPSLALTGRGVLIGIVDTGIDFTLDEFKSENGATRIVSIYDQTSDGPPPPGFPYGREYTREDINAALSLDDPYSAVKQRDTSGHGTFLASVAAGRNLSNEVSGAAPDAEIVVVKLKEANGRVRKEFLVPDGTADVFDSTSVMLGVEYVVRKARELDRPVSICLALGTNFGTHDGSGVFEDFIDSTSGISGVCITVAAGNESQSRRHARLELNEDEPDGILDIRSSDSASSFCLTLLTSFADKISVSLRSPTGEVVPRIPVRNGSVYKTGFVFEKATVSVEYYYPLSESTSQATVIKTENATQGVWNVFVYGDILTAGRVDAYLPSKSLIPQGAEFVLPDPFNTVTVPATSRSPISVSAYDTRDGSLYIDSSWGFSVNGLPLPDLAAPGVGVRGSYPTFKGTMSGTSVSSAITCGAAALMLEWGVVDMNYPTLNTHQIKGFLIRSCVREESRAYPDPRWGYGKLNLYRAFEMMRSN